MTTQRYRRRIFAYRAMSLHLFSFQLWRKRELGRRAALIVRTPHYSSIRLHMVERN